jgi:hypothetical protein
MTRSHTSTFQTPDRTQPGAVNLAQNPTGIPPNSPPPSSSNQPVLDLRDLAIQDYASIRQIVDQNPNTSALLDARQKAQLVTDLLDQMSAAVDHSPPSPIQAYVFALADEIVSTIPRGLLHIASVEVFQKAMALWQILHENTHHTGGWHAAKCNTHLAIALLVRCENEGLIPHPTRLYLALEALHAHPWGTPCSEPYRMLMATIISMAIKNRNNDPHTQHAIFSRMALVMDTERNLRYKTKNAAPADQISAMTSISPTDMLCVMLHWGLDPSLRNHHGETTIEQLQRQGHGQAATLLQNALDEVAASSPQSKSAAFNRLFGQFD